MPHDNIPHAYVPYGTTKTANAIDEQVQPCLRLAYPLPRDHAEDRTFQRLLDALAQKIGPASVRAEERTSMP